MVGELDPRGAAAPGPEPARPAGAQDTSLSLLLYLARIFTTRFPLFAAVFIVVLAAVFWFTMQSTRYYRASAEILIERQQSNLKDIASPVVVNTDDLDYYNTQVKILQGLGLAERVARIMKLHERPEFRGGNQEPAEHLLENLTIDYQRYNRIVQVSFEHHDPQFAADLVTELVREYRAWSAERHAQTINELHDDLERQMEGVATQLTESETALRKFYDENQLLLGEERLSSLQHLMDEAGGILLREEQDLARLESAASKIETVGDDPLKLMEIAIAENTFWREDTLMAQHAGASSDLAEIRKEYMPDHPKYLAAAARLEELHSKVSQHARMFAQSVGVQRDNKREGVRRARFALEDLRKRRLAQDKLVAQAEVMRRTRDANHELHDALVLRIKESRIQQGLKGHNVQVIRPARPPRQYVRPNIWFNLVLGSFAAVVVGVGVTLLRDRFDNSVRTPDDVEEAYSLPVLTVVPMSRIEELSGPAALACWKDESSQLAESFRRLRAAILLSLRPGEGGPLRRIMIASAGPDEGKSVTAMNLAISLAQMGERTLYLDTDFYRSESHKLLGLDREKGLSTILVSDIPLEQAVQPTAIPCLDYMATGLTPPQPATLLGSARMRWLLDEASRVYSRIVIDTAPIVAVTDTSLVAPHADVLIMVVREGKTLKTALHRSLQTLLRSGVRPFGFVFNGVRRGMGEFYFRYHHPTYTLETESAPVSGAPPR